jgi:hypothetical protein
MGFKFGGQIILNNLVLYLDASNSISYPGAGSIWFDISGYGNHFNLQGSPTADGNSLMFNYSGGNQYASANNTSIGDFGTGSFTIEYVANFPSTNSSFGAVARTRDRVSFGTGGSNAGWSLGIINQSQFQDNGTITNPTEIFANATDQPIKDKITHQVYTIQRYGTNNDNVTATLYITGSVIRTINYTLGTTRGGDGLITNPSSMQIMINQSGYSQPTGSIYLFRMYNRALTNLEVNSNFNSIRSKYGM